MKPHIQIIVGTTRPNRVGRTIADWITELALERSDATYELIDLAEVNLPLYNEPRSAMNNEYEFDYTKKWSEIISKADGYIFVTGEYNHGIPASLKNAIDYLYYEWHHKPVAYVGYGGMGAARAIEHLLSVANELRMVPVRDRVHIIDVWSAIGEDGKPKREFVKNNPEELFKELEWWAKITKPAREA
jgi:NAD(P)H-dependent FMN reductase